VIQGSGDKLADLGRLLARLGITLPETAMIGDDLPDVPVLCACGLPIAVANAVPEVKAAARLVTERPGGAGAVREALEHILRPDGRWARVLAHYGITRA
jgi:3-deoxy-D-manno-octulosonate 8-phosphate phosphatase (KDO 8-P phosphatase)